MDKDEKDFVSEELKEKELPESPASVNVRGYLKGFSIQFTKRGDAIVPLYSWVTELVSKMEADGFKPSWNTETNGKTYAKTPTGNEFPDDSVIKESTPCWKCGEATTLKSGEKNGKKWTARFCSTDNRSHTQWL